MGNLSDSDIQQIKERGSDLQEVKKQLDYFEKGFPYMQVVKAATVEDGISKLADDEIESYQQRYQGTLPDKKVVKFIPASGAASRMFKKLFAFAEEYSEDRDTDMGNPEDLQSVAYFFKNIKDFAFYEDLRKELLRQGRDMEEDLREKNYDTILHYLLDEEGLNYGNLPKGLLKFHSYAGSSRTPAEEHLVEAANYCKDKNSNARLHFTVSPEHQDRFEELIADKKGAYEQEFGVSFEVKYSQQKPSTDTIAVDMDNEPFREEDGSILFRPGGHGALLSNLDDIDADLIFIKNIDNVVPDRLKGETYRYKEVLGGMLLAYQEKIFEFQDALDNGTARGQVDQMLNFLKEQLCTLPPEEFGDYDQKRQLDFLRDKFFRPVRVCGMVKNEGEPGGGPFWAKNPDETVSLQIVESAQIDEGDPKQTSIQQNATHFNPVDIVCATRDYRDRKYDLLKYRDPDAGFISEKSKDGRELKAQELPGLWNGSMSDWNTIFVEVPIVTFNPVKTVNDLLRKNHQ